MKEQPVLALKLFNVDQVAGMLNLGRSKIYGYILSGELRSIKAGRRRLFTPEAVTDFINRLAQQGNGSGQ